ncbi:MAG: hypothetical protein ACYDIC_12595 [Desulfobaccales bacterium]
MFAHTTHGEHKVRPYGKNAFLANGYPKEIINEKRKTDNEKLKAQSNKYG